MPEDNQKSVLKKSTSAKPTKTPEWIREIALGHQAEKKKAKLPNTTNITDTSIGTERRPTPIPEIKQAGDKTELIQKKPQVEETKKIRERLKKTEELRRRDKEKVQKIEEEILREEKRIDELLKVKFS